MPRRRERDEESNKEEFRKIFSQREKKYLTIDQYLSWGQRLCHADEVGSERESDGEKMEGLRGR